MSPIAALAAMLALVAAMAGVAMLRAVWLRPAERWRVAGGWAILAAGVPSWRASGLGWDTAVALAALVPSLAAMAALALLSRGLWPKAGRRRAARKVEPFDAVVLPAWRRGLAQGLMAGPLALVAAIGLSVAWAAHGPFADVDRTIGALFLAPVLWAAGAIWATSDGWLVRVGAGLALAAAAGFGVAAL